MFALEVDESKNLIFIKLDGFIHNIRAGVFANKVKSALFSRPKGFTIITDLTALESGSEESIVVLREIMELVAKQQPGKVIRIENNNIAKNQFDQAWNKAYVDYNVIRVSSRDQAFMIVKN